MGVAPTRDSNPLELSEPEMRALVEAAMVRIVRHIESLPDQPAANTDGAVELARSLVESAPQQGGDVDELPDLLFAGHCGGKTDDLPDFCARG